MRACFTPRVKHALTFICGGRGSEMGCTVGRPPGGLTGGRGRGVLGLGGLRACEGVRGRARACEGVFYPNPILPHCLLTHFMRQTKRNIIMARSHPHRNP